MNRLGRVEFERSMVPGRCVFQSLGLTMCSFAWAFLSCTNGALGALAAPDQTSLIAQALNEPTQITLANIRLGDAIDAITEQTGVRIVVPSHVMRLAPYGGDTLIEEVEIANTTLSRGLTELFNPLGMTFKIRDDHLEIVAMPGLKWIGRRPTWKELRMLTWLAGLQLGCGAQGLDELKSKMQIRVPQDGAWDRLSAAICEAGTGGGDELLSIACERFGWVWYPIDERIVVTTRERRIRENMNTPLSIRLSRRPLLEIIRTIGRRVGLDVRVEPSALASLPPHVRDGFSATVENEPVREVFDRIAAYTGLGYLIDEDGVLFYASPSSRTDDPRWGDPTETRPIARAEDDPIVAEIAVPMADGSTARWLVRRSELPDDLRDQRASDLAKLFDSLRQSAKKPD